MSAGTRGPGGEAAKGRAGANANGASETGELLEARLRAPGHEGTEAGLGARAGGEVGRGEAGGDNSGSEGVADGGGEAPTLQAAAGGKELQEAEPGEPGE